MLCIHEIEEAQCTFCNGREVPTFGRSLRRGVASVFFDVGTVDIDTPYDSEFVDALKAALPYSARTWDGDRRVWVISSEWWAVARAVVEEYFDVAE